MSIEAVDEIAQGRVWSGVDAKELGLVDEIGNLDAAIAAAAEMVDLETYGIRKYPKYKSEFQRIMEDFGGAKAKVGEAFIKEELGDEVFQVLKEVKQLSNKKGIQARMPFTLNIK